MQIFSKKIEYARVKIHWSKLWPFYRYPWISQIFQRFKSTD